MALTIFVLVLIAAGLFVAAWLRGDGSHARGLRLGVGLLYRYLPLLLLAFAAAGLLQVVLPAEVVSGWLGTEAGWRGIVIGSVAGMLIPGGPYISFPIIASVMKSGAGMGTVVAMVTSWALLNPTKYPFELALLGPRFTAVRIIVVCVMPLIAGFLAQLLFAGLL